MSLAMPAHPPSSPYALERSGESSRTHLPEQVFSSPSDQNLYPASTLAAVEATRARFFARGRGGGGGSSRPTPRRAVTSHPLSAQQAGSYRQSFYERCQHAMDHTRSAARKQRVESFRKGQSEFTRGFFSDEAMEVEDDESAAPSSPGPDEDDELVRRKIIAEYSRLKRIYELKGHLEIGWLHPDQVAWLEEEMQQHHPSALNQESRATTAIPDPFLDANDEQLEQLWIHSQQQDTLLDLEFNDTDAAFEQALANLPY